MQLTQQQFIDLLNRFESTPEPEELRRSVRILIRRHVAILVDQDSEQRKIDMVLQDISRSGVCLTYHEGMPREKRFVLLLPSAPSGHLSIPCIVRHCGMVKQHFFRIGAEFESVQRLTP